MNIAQVLNVNSGEKSGETGAAGGGRQEERQEDPPLIWL